MQMLRFEKFMFTDIQISDMKFAETPIQKCSLPREQRTWESLQATCTSIAWIMNHRIDIKLNTYLHDINEE